MKVLHVNTFDISGGAARAAYRLHRALLEKKINSLMLVQAKDSDDYTVVGEPNKIRRVFNKLRPWLDSIPLRAYKNKTKTLFSVSWLSSSRLVNKINAINPDVVHLHWVCGGLLKIEDLVKIKAPLVWSLHDNWAFTGGCHIMWDCQKYTTNCRACPRLGSSKDNDLSQKVFERKRKVFAQLSQLKIIGLSQWISLCAQKSTLLGDKEIITLPNPVDTQKYKPMDKASARYLWNLPLDKKIILFGAPTQDINKGFAELQQALSHLKTTSGDAVELVVFGSSEPEVPVDIGFKTHYLGSLSDDVSLMTLFNVADVMVVPSLQENLSNAIMESLSCGTPVVAFNIGGNSDLIEHKINGYLASAYDTHDLATGIEWVLKHASYASIAANARQKVLENFASTVVASKYIDVYQALLSAS